MVKGRGPLLLSVYATTTHVHERHIDASRGGGVEVVMISKANFIIIIIIYSAMKSCCAIDFY